MRLKQGGIPLLLKPVPYAIAPTRVELGVYYTFGLTRERVLGIVVLTILSLCMIALTIYTVQRNGLNSAAWYSGGRVSADGLLILTILTVGVTAWIAFVFGKYSQVCVFSDSGTAQIQYNYKRNSKVAPASIVVQSAKLTNGKNSRPGSGELVLRLAEMIEPGGVTLVVIAIESDFEVIGAFKSVESALEFAVIVEDETGLEIVDTQLPELSVVFGHRSYGFGSSDKRAIRKRYSSHVFKAGI